MLGKALLSLEKLPEKLAFQKINYEEHFTGISTIRQCNKHYTEVHAEKFYSLLIF